MLRPDEIVVLSHEEVKTIARIIDTIGKAYDQLAWDHSIDKKDCPNHHTLIQNIPGAFQVTSDLRRIERIGQEDE